MDSAELSLPGGCAVCGRVHLVPHLAVAGQAGPEGLIPSTNRFGTALADIVRCPSCSHMQLARFPHSEVLESAYQEAESDDYEREEQGQRATARVTLARIHRFVKPGALLDLGCWMGYLLDEARRDGWQTVGVEPSRFASRFARERLGLDVRTEDLFAAELEPGSFHAVVMADVIEHLSDPGQALDRIAAVVAPGAIMYLALPDAGSRLARVMGARWWSVIPTHLQYFTQRSLATLLNRHGWQVLRVETAPKAFSVRYYLGRIGGYSPVAGRVLVRIAALLGIADLVWAPDFGDRMAVIARAPAAPLPPADRQAPGRWR